jgi:chromosome segregation ATPase
MVIKNRSGSVHSLSPVSPARLDFTDAIDVLSASIDSALAREISKENLATGSQPEDAVSMLDKCRSLIDELQSELCNERSRSVELEAQVDSLQSDLDTERRKLREERAGVEQLRREKAIKAAAPDALQAARNQIAEKERELENMTSYCEKRVRELKQALKDSSTTLTPSPAPVPIDLEQKISQLTEQLSHSSAVIRAKEAELSTVAESYEKQVRMLKAQLKSTEDLLSRISPVTTPSPRLDPRVADLKSFVDSEFMKLNKTTLRTLNPYAN